MLVDSKFYKGKKVFVTGHTGFKGSYLCEILLLLDAKVYGYALKEEDESLYKLLNLNNRINSTYGDIRDYKKLEKTLNKVKPDIVIHMAAQPLVRLSYEKPLYTYETNVIGTANVLEAIRQTSSVKSVIVVTTDKVYLNRENNKPFKESEELNGFDPYSNSKSCSELVTSTYRQCFFKDRDIAITTCRAGNVIGGGDFAKDRIIPDTMRAIINHKDIIIRNPNSIRPYQHVLEPITTYLHIAMMQYKNKELQGAYNIGPEIKDCLTTKDLIALFVSKWNKLNVDNKIKYICKKSNGPHEANFLKLDCAKAKRVFKYKSLISINKAIDNTVKFISSYINNGNFKKVINMQIKEFIK